MFQLHALYYGFIYQRLYQAKICQKPSSKTMFKIYDPKHIVEGSEYQQCIRISNSLQQIITVLYCICFPFSVIF